MGDTNGVKCTKLV